MTRQAIFDEHASTEIRAFIKGLTWLTNEQSLVVFEMLERYLKEVELWNPRIGLIEAQGYEVIYKHVFDCMAAADHWRSILQDGQKIVDLGTGAGLPGFLLSILFPKNEWTLVDKQERRIAFLRNVKAMCGSRNTRLEHQRASDLKESFDLVTSRAYTPLDQQSLDDYLTIVKPGGIVVLYKGRLQKIKEELESVKLEHQVTQTLTGSGLIPRFAHIVPVIVPKLNEERHLVIIQKA